MFKIFVYIPAFVLFTIFYILWLPLAINRYRLYRKETKLLYKLNPNRKRINIFAFTALFSMVMTGIHIFKSRTVLDDIINTATRIEQLEAFHWILYKETTLKK